ncbi:MAG: SurA N-terminal domain-containing protein, partial [Pseudolabrys sp.]
MLRGIHKASSTWLGKALMAAIMGFIAISFAVWGIGDIFRGFGQNAVATIGGAEISLEQFRQFYNERLQQLGRQVGRPITPDEARARGLDRQLLGQLIAETTLDEQAKKLRLGLITADIAKRITDDPSFRGPNGQFDRARFEQIIRQAGFTESRFVDEQRRTMLRRQIAQSITSDMKVPTTAMTVLNQYRNEKRQIEYITLGTPQ